MGLAFVERAGSVRNLKSVMLGLEKDFRVWGLGFLLAVRLGVPGFAEQSCRRLLSGLRLYVYIGFQVHIEGSGLRFYSLGFSDVSSLDLFNASLGFSRTLPAAVEGSGCRL